MDDMTRPAEGAIRGEEHWTAKDGDVKLFLFEKCAGDPAQSIGTILFVHGSSMAGRPTFDLQVPGRPDSSAMDHFARRGYDCWCVDMEGYGRSTKDRDNNAPIAQGADDCHAAATLYPEAARQTPAAGLWHFIGRAARGAVCRAPSRKWWRGWRWTPWCGPAKARRRWPSGARSCPSSSAKTAGQ